jgi:hypothetical protein
MVVSGWSPKTSANGKKDIREAVRVSYSYGMKEERSIIKETATAGFALSL